MSILTFCILPGLPSRRTGFLSHYFLKASINNCRNPHSCQLSSSLTTSALIYMPGILSTSLGFPNLVKRMFLARVYHSLLKGNPLMTALTFAARLEVLSSMRIGQLDQCLFCLFPPQTAPKTSANPDASPRILLSQVGVV